MASRRKHTIGVRDGPRRADGTARRNLEVASVDVLLVMRQHGSGERPNDLRARVHELNRRANREAEQHLDRSWPGDGGELRIRNRFRQTNVDIQTKRRRDLVLKELSQAAMMRIHTPQQLAFV